jgi:hypothetical protein
MTDQPGTLAFFSDRPFRMRWLRKIHEYLGLFIAPTLLMFTFTGALQLFGLHEAEGGYRPVPVVEKLAQLHIHQTYALRPQRGPVPGAQRPERQEVEPALPLGQTALKWMFLTTALGVMVSTSLGLWMGLTHLKNRGVALAVVAAGAALPILLVLL